MGQTQYCKNVRMLMKSTDYKPDRLTVARVRCKQWTCPACARRNLNQWRLHLLKRFSKDDLIRDLWCFITITVPPHLHGHPQESVTRLQRVWKRMYDLMRRKFTSKLSYVYMYEAHSDGTYHLHAIINCGRDYDKDALIFVWREPYKHHPLHRWFQDTLPTLGAGFITDVRRVYSMYGLRDSVSAILYAIKYMSKSGSWVQFKKHARRIGVTQDIGGLPKALPSEFTWSPVPYISLNDLARHKIIEDVTTRRELTRKDFDHGFYPPEHEE